MYPISDKGPYYAIILGASVGIIFLVANSYKAIPALDIPGVIPPIAAYFTFRTCPSILLTGLDNQSIKFFSTPGEK